MTDFDIEAARKLADGTRQSKGLGEMRSTILAACDEIERLRILCERGEQAAINARVERDRAKAAEASFAEAEQRCYQLERERDAAEADAANLAEALDRYGWTSDLDEWDEIRGKALAAHDARLTEREG